mmetsp:Transcript_15798/g.60149  ORF Transcript_15798/g.60149 Transcript_15798/m.60149 type:complete len:276 (+) Transcript_15798:1465-2292(+)
MGVIVQQLINIASRSLQGIPGMPIVEIGKAQSAHRRGFEGYHRGWIAKSLRVRCGFLLGSKECVILELIFLVTAVGFFIGLLSHKRIIRCRITRRGVSTSALLVDLLRGRERLSDNAAAAAAHVVFMIEGRKLIKLPLLVVVVIVVRRVHVHSRSEVFTEAKPASEILVTATLERSDQGQRCGVVVVCFKEVRSIPRGGSREADVAALPVVRRFPLDERVRQSLIALTLLLICSGRFHAGFVARAHPRLWYITIRSALRHALAFCFVQPSRACGS